MKRRVGSAWTFDENLFEVPHTSVVAFGGDVLHQPHQAILDQAAKDWRSVLTLA